MKPKSRKRKRDKKKQSEIAKERIAILFDLADQAALSKDIDLASTYVERARKIAMR